MVNFQTIHGTSYSAEHENICIPAVQFSLEMVSLRIVRAGNLIILVTVCLFVWSKKMLVGDKICNGYFDTKR